MANFAPLPAEPVSPASGAAGASPAEPAPAGTGADGEGGTPDFESMLAVEGTAVSASGTACPGVSKNSGTVISGSGLSNAAAASKVVSQAIINRASQIAGLASTYSSSIQGNAGVVAKNGSRRTPSSARSLDPSASAASAATLPAQMPAPQMSPGSAVAAPRQVPAAGSGPASTDTSAAQDLQDAQNGKGALVAQAPVTSVPDDALIETGLANKGYGVGGHPGREKSAVLENPSPAIRESSGNGADKNALKAAAEYVTDSLKGVGTGVAMPSSAMPSAAQVLQPSLPLTSGASATTPFVVERAPLPAPVQASTAQAVESALQISDLQATVSQATQSSVNLHFDVAGENLSVRVALQEGQVHTQFATDSGDLRAALAHEWHTVASTAGSSRVTEPVFTAQSHGDSGSELDNSGSGSQQRDWRQGESDGIGLGAPGTKAAATTAKTPDAGPAGDSAPLSVHLQSFA